MLPFLKPKQMSSVIIAKRTASGSVSPERVEGEATPEMHTHADAMLTAISNKDSKALATAMEAAHACLSSKTDSQKPDGEPV